MKTRIFRAALGAGMAIALGTFFPFTALAQPVPRYEVDAAWPKPLPDQWVVGGLVGLCIDSRDHVLVLHRQEELIEGGRNAGKPAPHMIEFDPDGNVVNSWGDPELLDPRLHSCHFDGDDNVWIASAPSGMVQKYSHDGARLLMQIGEKGVLDSSDGTPEGTPLNSNAAQFLTPSGIRVDRANGDIYVSDGEQPGSNRRIAVMDGSGEFLRQWVIGDMESVHCVHLSNDGMVYVCHRRGSEVRVYDKMGGLQRRIAVPWKPVTPPEDGQLVQSGGSAVDIAFSSDPRQRLMYVINQNNARIDAFERESGKFLTSFGRAGNYPGQFNQAHSIGVDSNGNVYVAENRGQRAQRFRPVTE
jgi:DNA-binding beta-propeller fold protein YncE